jgi:hypothetical protein
MAVDDMLAEAADMPEHLFPGEGQVVSDRDGHRKRPAGTAIVLPGPLDSGGLWCAAVSTAVTQVPQRYVVPILFRHPGVYFVFKLPLYLSARLAVQSAALRE